MVSNVRNADNRMVRVSAKATEGLNLFCDGKLIVAQSREFSHYWGRSSGKFRRPGRRGRRGRRREGKRARNTYRKEAAHRCSKLAAGTKQSSQKANWRSFWPKSAPRPYSRSASSHLLSELLCFTSPTTMRPEKLFGCSNAPVANESKDTGRCYFLLQGWDATTSHFRCITCVICNGHGECSNARG
jgi:hypothetical protein